MIARPAITMLALVAVTLLIGESSAGLYRERHNSRSNRNSRNKHSNTANEVDADTKNLNKNIIKIKGLPGRVPKKHHKSSEEKTTTTTTTLPPPPPPAVCGHTQYLNAGELPGSTALQQGFLGIVGGQEAKANEFPWQAVVIVDATILGGLPWQCGASVISEDYLLTTATCCMMGGNVTLTFKPPATVYYGVTSFGSPRTYNPFSGDKITPPTAFAASRKVFAMMVPDRQYAAALSLVGLVYNNDMCIIQVESPVSFNTWNIQPVCLPQSCDDTCKVGDEITVSGGGDQGYFLNGTFSVPNSIKYIKTKVLDRLRCQRQMDATRLAFSQMIVAGFNLGPYNMPLSDPRQYVIIELLLQLLDNPSELCYTGLDKGNFGTSFGDEGGPAVCLNKKGYYSLDYMQTINRLLTVVVNLIADDPTCGDPTKLPGVIASVCEFVPWIKSVTGLTFSPIPNPISPVQYTEVKPTTPPYQCGHTQYWNSGESFATFATLSAGQLAISGGTTAKLHEFPWQVLIKNCQGFCGGVVIAPEWILTSADCCSKFGIAAASPKLTLTSGSPTVYYGVTDFNFDGTPSFQPTAVYSSSVCDYYHYPYDTMPSMRYYGNLCLVKVRNPASFASWQIQPICLPKNCLSENTCTPKDTLIISGFGQTSNTPTYPASLQSATVTLKNYAQCRKDMYESCQLDYLAWADVGCYDAAQGQTKCGDEGGPASCFKPGYAQLDYVQTTDKRFTSTPKVSFMARVCYHMPWIRAITGYTFDEDTHWP